MARNVIGSLLALLGAAAAVWSPFRPWYDGRHGRDIRLSELFSADGPAGPGGPAAGLWTGMFLPMLAAALVTLLAVVLRSKLLLIPAALIVLGFTILWMVRRGVADGSLTAGGDGLDTGVGYALAGGAVILLGSAVMSGRRRRRRRHRASTGTTLPDQP